PIREELEIEEVPMEKFEDFTGLKPYDPVQTDPTSRRRVPFPDSQVGALMQRAVSRDESTWATGPPRTELKLQSCLDVADMAGWLPERSGWVLMTGLTVLPNWR
ncbi:hypothetical protein P7K49_028771, partial [Saguinus oedipus]